MKEKKWIQKLSDAFGRYKYVLLVALVGVILLTWPSGESAQAESPAPGIEEDLFQVSRMEEKLKRALSGGGSGGGHSGAYPSGKPPAGAGPGRGGK